MSSGVFDKCLPFITEPNMAFFSKLTVRFKFQIWAVSSWCKLNNNFSVQLPRVALMEQFVWLMDLWRVLGEWRSALMECGEQCVAIAGIEMMPKLCADNWGTMSTQEVAKLVHKWLP